MRTIRQTVHHSRIEYRIPCVVGLVLPGRLVFQNEPIDITDLTVEAVAIRPETLETELTFHFTRILRRPQVCVQSLAVLTCTHKVQLHLWPMHALVGFT